MTSYDLWYWPTIQGCGAFVRPALDAAGTAVAALPGIRASLQGDRRIGFNTDGIVRPYPELAAE